MTEQQLQNELAQVPLLTPLAYPALRRFITHGRLVQMHEGDIIIGPSIGSTGFFIVLEGYVTVVLPWGPVLAYLGKHEIFGENALLTGEERTAYCKAYTDGLLFEITSNAFQADLVTNLAVNSALAVKQAQRQAMNEAVRVGELKPDVEPPPKPEPEIEIPDEPAAQEAGAPANGKAAQPSRPPAVYATA